MEYNLQGNIVLSGLQCLAVLAFCLFAIRGYVEILLGPYIVLMSAAKTIIFGPIALFWIFAIAIIASTIVGVLREKKIMQNFAKRDTWIIFWMLGWWIWIFCELILFNPPFFSIKLRTLVMYVILPIVPSIFVGQSIKRINRFIIFYIIAVLINALIVESLPHQSINLSSLDMFSANKMIGLYIYNYHRVSVCFGVGIILSIYMAIKTKNMINISVFIVSSFIMMYVLYNTGSRQMILALLIGLLYFLLYFFRVLTIFRFIVASIAVFCISFIASMLYQSGINILSREIKNDLLLSLILALNERFQLWENGLSSFITSPLWGDGFASNPHNIFISTLSNQGIIGFFFFVGLLVFIFQLTTRQKYFLLDEKKYLVYVAIQSIIIFDLVRAQFSGDCLSVWNVYWSLAMMWSLSLKEDKSERDNSQRAVSGIKKKIIFERKITIET